MEFNKLIEENIANTGMIYAVFASPLNKAENKHKKITVKPIELNSGIIYQLEKFTDKQVFHENIDADSVADKMIDLSNQYKNANIFTVDADYQILVSKKGSKKIIRLKPTKTMSISSHNKIKSYIIPENQPCDFLFELGVMNKDGKVFAKKYDKFKQINKFLEIVDDAIDKIDIKSDYKIIDFGCGKAYLTFALYYYFYKIKKVNAQIIGLDLKTDVINFCNDVAKRLNYSQLRFENGDIKDYDTNSDIDMVVTLHACDNATDAALVKAIRWNADIILSVPCCQHEFFDKINNNELVAMLKHGLIKERLSSLVTDSLRCLFLEAKGYRVQLIEFVDMEHTPKNIMLKAIKSTIRQESTDEYESFKKYWNLESIFIDEYSKKINNR